MNPSNGEVIGNMYNLDVTDARAAVDAAHAAFKPWSQKTAKVLHSSVCRSGGLYPISCINGPLIGICIVIEENGVLIGNASDFGPGDTA